jgi:hypothetical protein
MLGLIPSAPPNSALEGGLSLRRVPGGPEPGPISARPRFRPPMSSGRSIFAALFRRQRQRLQGEPIHAVVAIDLLYLETKSLQLPLQRIQRRRLLDVLPGSLRLHDLAELSQEEISPSGQVRTDPR